jgi:hypothetical protein
MTGATRIDVVKAASATLLLALAVVVMRPLLPLAAQIWTANAAIADGPDVAEHGVLPATSVVRAVPKLRHLDTLDPPQPYAAIPPATDGSPCLAGTYGSDVVTTLPAELRFPGHRPRGPPGVSSPPSEAGLPECGRALGSLERA